MKLVLITALIAVCSAAKLDRTYLPPPSAGTAGGSHESLQTPLIKSSTQGSELPTPIGSYNNNFDGVVVDAAAPGTRASSDLSGLGAPRPSYGSTDSKVGDAAFRGSAFNTFNEPGFNAEKPGRLQAFNDRNSNILTYSNEVNSDKYSYGFETDNGIAVGENGVAVNGIQAEGGYSYTGDDGQVYKVTYVADDKGYRPVGAHLPTPPPIPEEILKSLEKNAKDEAAGPVDDGSYDAQKYNMDGDYTHHNEGNNPHNDVQLPQFGSRPESDAITSGTFINQNQAFGQPGQDAQNLHATGTQTNQGSVSNNFQQSQSTNNRGYSNNFQQSQSGNQFGTHGSQSQSHGGSTNGFQSSNVGQINQISTETANDKERFSNGFGTSHFNRESTGVASDVKGSSSQESHNLQEQSGNQFGTTDTGHNGQKNHLNPSNRFQNSQFGQYNDAMTHLGQKKGQHLSGFAQSGTQGNVQQQTSQFGFQANNKFSPAKPFGQLQNSFGSNKESQMSAQFGQSSGLSNGVSQGHNGNNYQSYSFQALSNQNQPISNAINTNKPANLVPNRFGSSSNVNRFTQSNKFEAANEYLPPKSNGAEVPQASLPSNQGVMNNGQTPNFVAFNDRSKFQQSFASASASIGPQPSQFRKPVNTFPSNGFTQSNNQFSQSQASQSNSSPTGQVFRGTSKPTAIPETELTTPLEPNEGSSSQSNQYSHSATSFSRQPSNNFKQFNSQFNQNKQPFGQTPSLPASQPQTSFSSKPESFGNSQLIQSDTQQTLKPFDNQGSDDSYYYNQPSKPFNSPAFRPQGSRFPSTSNNFGVQSNSQFINTQKLDTVAPTTSTQFDQSQGFDSINQHKGITQAAISSFPSVSPTSSSQSVSTSNQFGTKPAFFNQKQSDIGSYSQSLSSFSSRPIISQSNTASQFSQKPSAISSQPKPNPTENDSSLNTQPAMNEPIVHNQQYEGTIYQYNKPPQTLPAPQSDSDSSQTVQSSVASSQGNKVSGVPENSKPQGFSGSAPSQVQSSSSSGPAQPFKKPMAPFGVPSNSQSSQPQGSAGETSLPNGQTQFNGSPRPFGSNFGSSSQGYPSAAEAKPQFGLQYPQNQKSQNMFGNRQPSSAFNNNQGSNTFSQTNSGFPVNPQLNKQNLDQSSQTSTNQFTSAVASYNPTFSQTAEAITSQVPEQNSQSQSFNGLQKEPTQSKPFNSACCRDSVKPSQFGAQYSGFQGNVQNLAGKGEDFSGPRQPPSFDDNGYHY